MGGLQGKNSGWPSSKNPVKRLQIGFVPRSGRLFPTLTIIVAGLLAPRKKKLSRRVIKKIERKSLNCMKRSDWYFKITIQFLESRPQVLI